jgi:hypothetical protein
VKFKKGSSQCLFDLKFKRKMLKPNFCPTFTFFIFLKNKKVKKKKKVPEVIIYIFCPYFYCYFLKNENYIFLHKNDHFLMKNDH